MERLARRVAQSIQICEEGPWMLPENAKRPMGMESGEVYIIGVGGSTLRLTHVRVAKQRSTSEELLSVPISGEAKADDLFAWSANLIVPVLDRIARFEPTQQQDLPGHQQRSLLRIGVSWSFPLLKGRILSMGKQFSPAFYGMDLRDLFNAALPARYQVSSVTHDGTSSLIAGMHELPRCRMALTLGTGVNLNLINDSGVIINTEISMLGRADTTPEITLWTEEWDVDGPLSRFQPLETRVGGLYLGQMATNALGSETSTRQIWKILEDPSDGRYGALDAIVKRAASLVAVVIYGLLVGMTSAAADSDESVDVVYTGGVIFEPEFRSRLESRLQKLSKTFGFTVSLKPQRYGSEIGAAVAALAELENGALPAPRALMPTS